MELTGAFLAANIRNTGALALRDGHFPHSFVKQSVLS
jgi:hypothetical protein